MRLRTVDTLGLLKRMLDVRRVRDMELIEIRAFSQQPDEAARIANAVAESYERYQRERVRQSQTEKPNPLTISDRFTLIVDRAMPGVRPVRPNKPLNLAIGIVAGLVLGAGVTALLKFLATPPNRPG
jgi:capsular polysaccharide biosynthesis protein